MRNSSPSLDMSEEKIGLGDVQNFAGGPLAKRTAQAGDQFFRANSFPRLAGFRGIWVFPAGF